MIYESLFPPGHHAKLAEALQVAPILICWSGHPVTGKPNYWARWPRRPTVLYWEAGDWSRDSWMVRLLGGQSVLGRTALIINGQIWVGRYGSSDPVDGELIPAGWHRIRPSSLRSTVGGEGWYADEARDDE